MNRASSASGSPHDFPDVLPDVLPARGRARLAWLDFLRGAAVLVMIETHVVNTFLAAGLREVGWFSLLNYANGLVAPSFLFIAGFVQGMERRKSPGKPINYSRRASRLLGIGVLGYGMHFPIAAVAQRQWSEAFRIGSQVDVLQCLALGLGLLLGVGWLTERWVGRQKAIAWTLGVVALATVFVLGAPAVQAWVGGPVALRAWVNGSTGSLFPLFPWIGFVFLGAMMGALPVRPVAERTAGMVGLAVLAWTCRGTTFFAFSPAFFLERAVWVLALAAICEWSARQPLPSLVLYTGKHSLKFYVAHLALITALVGAGVPSSAMEWPATLALLAIVGASTFGVARFFDRLPQFLPLVRPVPVVEPRMAAAEDLPGAAA